MQWSRSAYVAVAVLFVIATVIQVFLGGLAVMSGRDIDAHRLFGYVVMHLLPILMIVLAFMGKMNRAVIGMSVALLVLVILQSAWVSSEGRSWIRAIHPTMALFIFGLGIDLMRRGFVSLRGAA
jgi:Family of unknown function (DUF6220)